MSLLYGIISLAAFILIGVCLAVDRKRDIYLLLLFISVFIADLGTFLISTSPTLGLALNANRLAYLGQVFLPFFLLKMILHFCNIQHTCKLNIILLSVSFIILLITFTPGILPWYYKSAAISTDEGYTKIIREYGPLHALYFIYLSVYALGTLGVAIHAIRKRWITQKMQIVFLLCAVLCNIVIWLIEQFLPRGFEILTVSYLMTEIFILLLYGIVQEYELLRRDAAALSNGATVASENPEVSELYTFNEETIKRVFEKCPELSILTVREAEVLKGLLYNKKRKEIAEELFISESAIGKHTSAIFKKLAVGSRKELYTKPIQSIQSTD